MKKEVGFVLTSAVRSRAVLPKSLDDRRCPLSFSRVAGSLTNTGRITITGQKQSVLAPMM
jgi:hypothetical protein